jgi:hypothetical protein
MHYLHKLYEVNAFGEIMFTCLSVCVSYLQNYGTDIDEI